MSSNSARCARFDDDDGGHSVHSIYERAYQMHLDEQGEGDTLDWGSRTSALQTITGQEANSYSGDDTPPIEDMAQLLENDRPMAAGTGGHDDLRRVHRDLQLDRSSGVSAREGQYEDGAGAGYRRHHRRWRPATQSPPSPALLLRLAPESATPARRSTMTVPHLLDHIVIAGPDLAETVEWFRELTGVTAAPGGTHPTGTANALVALTVNGEPRPHYLELIGPDPEREEEELPKTFSINRLKKPTLITYAVHPQGIERVREHARAEGVDLGEVQDLSRRTSDGTELTWRLTQAQAPRNYAVPFLIDWGETTQPGLTDLPSIELLSFERVEVNPAPQQKAAAALGLDDGIAPVREGRGSRFVLTLRTEDGREIEI